jgi:hypothetical protein
MFICGTEIDYLIRKLARSPLRLKAGFTFFSKGDFPGEFLKSMTLEEDY